MKILVISGFLGAGKTTFIRELYRRTGGKIAVMENEYGQAGVDGEILEKDGPASIWELTEGCICCSAQSDFAGSILTIANTVDPDFLIVEPTGVGMLSRVLENIRLIEYERIGLLPPVTILDPDSFERYRREFGEIYLDQIRAAERILLSKVDLPEKADRSAVLEQLRGLNPGARIEAEHYSKKPDSWWRSFLEEETYRSKSGRGEGYSPRVRLEGNNFALVQGDRAALMGEQRPADLESFTVREAHLADPGMLVQLLEGIIRGACGEIVRAKGTVYCGTSQLRFDIADRSYSITGAQEAQVQCVFIGKNLQREALWRLLLPGGGEAMPKRISPRRRQERTGL